jgi:hypothetical protein
VIGCGTLRIRLRAAKSADPADARWSRLIRNSSRSPRAPARKRTVGSGTIRKTIRENGAAAGATLLRRTSAIAWFVSHRSRR